MKEFGIWLIGFCCGVFGTVFVLVAITTPNKIWHKEAIDRGYAEHDPVTGKWQWIEPDILKLRQSEKILEYRLSDSEGSLKRVQ